MNILKRIFFGIANFFISTWYIWLAIIFGVIIHLIWGDSAGIFTFFGIILSFIVYIFGRQIWWFISGTGDYQGRNGLLKRFWNLIFKRND